ncbi:MAG: lipid-binding SYLF domain-containing protein, partial [Acidobacteriaceae bacterium]
MKKSIALWAAAMLAAATSVPAFAQAKADMELDQASQIMQQLTGPQSTAGIPDAVLKDAKCVAVIPKMIKGGFVVGAQHGDGVATCRLANGRWSPP